MIAIKNNLTSFLSTNATDPTTAYIPTTTYVTGDERRYENYIYKSTHDNNTGNNPLLTNQKDWVEWNPANDYSMLDYYRETTTKFPTNANGIVIFERGLNEVILIGQFNAEQITIEYLDDTNTVINPADTETYNFSVLMNKYDIWSYIYGNFEFDTTQILYKPIKKIGTRVRITFIRTAFNNYCGIFFAGEVIDFGETLDSVHLSNTKYGKKLARVTSFSTVMNKTELMYNLEKADVNDNEIMAFVIDPSDTSSHNNIVIIGTFQEHNGTAENKSKNFMQFKIEQNIRK